MIWIAGYLTIGIVLTEYALWWGRNNDRDLMATASYPVTTYLSTVVLWPYPTIKAILDTLFGTRN